MLDAAQPTHERVSQRRGMRLVSRKLMSSCCTTRSIRERAVILLSFACNTVRAEDSRDQTDTWLSAGCLRAGGAAAQGATAAAALAGQAPLADGALAHGAPLRRAGAVLRIRRGRTFSSADAAPEHIAATRREGFLRLAASLAGAQPKNRGIDRRGHGRHFRSAIHRPLPRALPVQPLRAPPLQGGCLRRVLLRRHRHRSRRQSVLRPDRLLRRQRVRLRLLQGVHRPRQRARSRPGTRARLLPSGDRLQRAPAPGDLGHGARCPSTCRAPKR